MINDLTKGAPLKLMLLFSIPLLIGNIFQQFYNVADIIIVGRTLGMNALAAVGAVSPLFFLIMFIIVGLTNGFSVITGQKFGAKDFDAVKFEKAVADKLGLIPQIAFRYRGPYFNHIFAGGYAAGYYSYLWAEVLDADGFEAFKESGDVLNASIGRSFRTNILEKGGSDDPMTLYKNFRGSEPHPDALLRNRGLK